MGKNYSIIDLQPLEYHYRSVVAGMRICQLYFFMLMFTTLSKPVSYVVQWMGYGLAQLISVAGEQASSATKPDLDSLLISLQGPEILVLLSISLVFWIYARFTPAYWVLLICAYALAQNVWGQFYWTFPNGNALELAASQPGDSIDFTVAGQIYMIVVVLTHCYFWYIAALGQKSIHRLKVSDREILGELSEDQPKPILGQISSTLRELVNVPIAIRYSENKVFTATLTTISGVANFMNFWRMSLAVLFLATLPVLAEISGPAIKTAIGNIVLGDNFIGSLLMLLLSLSIPLIVALIFWLNIWVIRRLCTWSVNKARDMMRVSLQDIQHLDQRKPILFLRSFLNDKVDLNAAGFSFRQWLLDASSRAITLDDLMLREGTVFGPTVALGNPDDPAPPYGVARGYFSHETWKDAVANLCADSQFIVMALDTTEGVDWEVKHIVGREYVDKTLFLLSPDDVNAESGVHLLNRALSKIDSKWNDDTTQQAHQLDHVFGFVVDKNHGVILLRTSTLSSYSYLIALRWFTRSKLELKLCA